MLSQLVVPGFVLLNFYFKFLINLKNNNYCAQLRKQIVVLLFLLYWLFFIDSSLMITCSTTRFALHQILNIYKSNGIIQSYEMLCLQQQNRRNIPE